MDNKYKDYFDIDPDYFPAVNPDVIKSNPELWKKFYPHETFIKLIKDIVSKSRIYGWREHMAQESHMLSSL